LLAQVVFLPPIFGLLLVPVVFLPQMFGLLLAPVPAKASPCQYGQHDGSAAHCASNNRSRIVRGVRITGTA
jgi:hypothetical protein